MCTCVQNFLTRTIASLSTIFVVKCHCIYLISILWIGNILFIFNLRIRWPITASNFQRILKIKANTLQNNTNSLQKSTNNLQKKYEQLVAWMCILSRKKWITWSSRYCWQNSSVKSIFFTLLLGSAKRKLDIASPFSLFK